MVAGHPVAAIADYDGALEIIKQWCKEQGYTPETIKIVRVDGAIIAREK
jgi:hypothetical protein